MTEPLSSTLQPYQPLAARLRPAQLNEFIGQEPWNLKSGNGDEVAPGLYIYTIESGNGSSYDKFKHIGKFAIVR